MKHEIEEVKPGVGKLKLIPETPQDKKFLYNLDSDLNKYIGRRYSLKFLMSKLDPKKKKAIGIEYIIRKE